MRDKYFDPDGWKRCTLRHNIDLGQGLWLLCGSCQKSRYFDTAEWAKTHGVDLDTPLKTLGKAIRCQRCGARAVSAYAEPYSNRVPQPRHRLDDDPICPVCGSDDVRRRRILTTDYPPRFQRKFMRGHTMQTCGCEICDNWWTQVEGIRLRHDASQKVMETLGLGSEQ
jgi:hypothetical protein